MLPFPFFKGGLPKWLKESYFNNDIQKFVQQVVEESISSSMENAKTMEHLQVESEEDHKPANDSLNAITFESHDHVYVKVLIKNEEDLRNLKIYHSSNQVIIEGIPTIDHRHVITLPSLVKMKESVSEYRNQFLQIQMRKRNDLQFTEVDVPSLE